MKSYALNPNGLSKNQKARVERANRRAEAAHRNDEEDEVVPACMTDSNGCLELMLSGNCSCSMVHK